MRVVATFVRRIFPIETLDVMTIAVPRALQADSEEDLQRQLHVERLARTDAGGTARITDGVANRAQAAAHAAAGLSEVHAVEDVEHLHAQLRSDAWRDRDVLED